MKDIFKIGFTPMFQNKGLDDVNVTTLDTNSIPEGYVDLGLPNGTLWATCNLGASKPEEYGKYFQWGDTVGYEGDEARARSTWETAPFNNGANEFNARFFNKHKSEWLNGDILKPKYDAVYQVTNGLAHMPTIKQVDELIHNTTKEWITNYNGSGVNGMRFTSKADQSKFIFIPAAGYIKNGSIYGTNKDGYVWSSSIYFFDFYYTYYLYFSNNYTFPAKYYGSSCGRSIRGVIG